MSLKFELSTGADEFLIEDGEEKESYSPMQIPNENSILVKKAAASLYGRIDPVTLYNNLSICADLFEVTYDAVDGMEGLQSSVWKLRQNLNKASIDSADDYVREFINRVDKIPGYYKIGVKALLSEPINGSQALKVFSLISAEAAKISSRAKELIDMFKTLQNEAGEIVTRMLDARALDVKQKKQLEDNVAGLKAKMDGLKAVQDDLESEIEELSEKYKEIDKKIDRASNQQFWMGITSALCGAIGTGLSAYVSTTGAGAANNIGKNVADAVSSEKQNASVQNTQKRLDEVNEKMKASEERINALKKQLSDKDKELNDENDKEKKKALLKEKEELASKLEQEQAGKRALEAQAKSYTDVISGISAGLPNLSGSLDKQASELSDTVAALTKLADDISEKRAVLRKEKREILRQVAEYTKTVENSVVTKNSLDLAISALSAGIGAMNYIVSVLNDFYTFWTSVKTQTGSMAEGEIENYITLFEDDPEELRTINFYVMLASNAAQWVALKLVLTDYQHAFYRVSDKLQAQLNVKQDSNPEIMWKRAIELSKGKSVMLEIQEKNI